MTTSGTDGKLYQPLLRQFSKQIAGHADQKGSSKPGMMKHADGSLLKPILPPPRGPRELNFYVKVFAEPTSGDGVVESLRTFLPEFRGIFRTEGGREFLKLEDLTEDFARPCILDVKMGKRTYDCEASAEKIRREESKYQHTKAFGFCIPGMRVYDVRSRTYICKEKDFGKGLNLETTKLAFRLYLNSDNSPCASILRNFLRKLHLVRKWFNEQLEFQFIASSLLFIYDADSLTPSSTSIGGGEESDRTVVKMIDFAHVFDQQGRLDDNYLFGLDNLIKIFESLLLEEEEKHKR